MKCFNLSHEKTKITMNMNLKSCSLIALGLLAAVSVASANPFSRKTDAKDGNADLGLPPYTGVKHAIAVVPFENTSMWKSSIDLQENMTGMLENVLMSTGRFVVVERENMGSTLNEQDLQSGGRAAQAGGVAQTGLIRSAKYLARAQILGVEANESGSDVGLNIKGVRLGLGGNKAQMEILIKIFDSTTSELLASQRIVGKAGGRSISVGYTEDWFSGDIGGFSKTPIGEAAFDCIAQAVKFIAQKFEDYQFDGSVVTVAGERIVINRGSNYNVTPGMRLQVREVGEILTDPETGEVLDRLEGAVSATIEVSEVKEKIAYCKLLSGEMPKKGDSVIGI